MSNEAIQIELFKDNVIANTLSDAVTNRNTQRERRHDEATQMLGDAISKGYIPQHLGKQLVNNKHVFQDLSVKDNAIMGRRQIVVLLGLRNKFVHAIHKGHQGFIKTKQYLQSPLWFPNINNHVQKTLKDCLPCQAAVNTKQREPLTITKLLNGPWYHMRRLIGTNPESILYSHCTIPVLTTSSQRNSRIHVCGSSHTRDQSNPRGYWHSTQDGNR